MNMNENSTIATYPPYVEYNYAVGDLVEIGVMKCDFDSINPGPSIDAVSIQMKTYATFDKTTTGMILLTPTVEKDQNDTMFILLVNEQIGVFPHWMIRPLER